MIPVKPFDTYKWRWLSVAPTESLLEPPVLLGVLRVLSRHEGDSPSTPEITDELKTVQTETNTPVNLARTAQRNIIRNSGQYWKGTGLLTPERGEIHLTSLGRHIAQGRITQSEFAAIMVQQAVLPNPWTYTSGEIAKWRASNLEIHPLALILSIIEELKLNHGGSGNAYLSPRELIRIVIPLAGIKATVAEISNFVAQFRQGKLDISLWPNCAPESNDTRLAREFLLFLANFGLCRKVEKGSRLDDRYYADEVYDAINIESITKESIFSGDIQADNVLNAVRSSSLPSIIERQRTTTTVLSRAGQPRFRKQILKISNEQCLVTGEKIVNILEAAHIIPVNCGGTDDSDNGICLRVDIHRLFDSGNIRLRPSGDLQFSDVVKLSKNYLTLPTRINLPTFVKKANIEWRDKYW
jgi:hypothetical protein